MSSSLSPSLLFEPRLEDSLGHSSLKLGEAIELLLESDQPKEVQILGASAEHAIAWARKHFGDNPRLKWYEDEPFGNPTTIGIDADDSFSVDQISLQLAALDRDDVIRYLLEYRAECCGSVLARLRPDDFSNIGSDLRIWIPLLNEMVDREHASVDELLWSRMLNELGSGGVKTLQAKSNVLSQLKNNPKRESSCLWSLLSIPSVQNRLITEVVVEQLRSHSKVPLTNTLTRDVILDVAETVSRDVQIQRFLGTCCSKSTSSMACSILHHSGSGWQPIQFFKSNFLGAQFDQANWLEIEFKDCKLLDCILQSSNFDCCKSFKCDFERCDLSECSLRGSSWDSTLLTACKFAEADFTGSKLNRCSNFNCNFAKADFTGSTLSNCKCQSGDFYEAEFSETEWLDSGFVKCCFEQTRFYRTRAKRCTFVDCQISKALLYESHFEDCVMNGVDLEDVKVEQMRLEGCQLSGALLTGSELTNCEFRNCVLHQAKLAEILWRNCDLRGADLRGVYFHFGSTRCGLVGSPYPSHGTRTGFYTDVLEEQYYKDKEQIRRAALLDCDLTGANIDGVDFYLVDLSGCKLNASQRRQAIATGALGLE